MSNFVSNSDAQALFEVVGKKKLTIVDVMPTADESNVGIPYIYIGADTQDFEEGGVYKCQEVTPATDPKTYEYIKIFTVKVDLSLYKRIFGDSVDAWDLLTDEQKAQYEYTFFDDDSSDYFAVVDAVTDGDMHPVTSNAVYDYAKGTEWLETPALNGNTVRYRKHHGNMVTINRATHGTSAAKTWVKIANLPEGYRPSYPISQAIYYESDNSFSNIRVQTNGDVEIYSASQNYVAVYNITFLVD